MAEKVYIVTAGEYSDYRILAVFSSKERAEDWIDHIGQYEDYCYIEEYEVDCPPRKWVGTYVWITRDGTVVDTWTTLWL